MRSGRIFPIRLPLTSGHDYVATGLVEIIVSWRIQFSAGYHEYRFGLVAA